MNKISMVGRLVRDVDLRYSAGEEQKAFARFTVALDRKVAKDATGQTTDFIPCVAFGKTAEFLEKYFSKGQGIALNGRLTSGSYTNKDGVKVYTLDVLVEEVEFVGDKKSSGVATNAGNVHPLAAKGTAPSASKAVDEFAPIPGFDDVDDGFPFM